MNVTEAQQVNTLLHWLLKTAESNGTLPTHEQGMAAAAGLAGRSYRTIAAGYTDDDVRAQWHWRDTPTRPPCQLCGHHHAPAATGEGVVLGACNMAQHVTTHCPCSRLLAVSGAEG